MLTLKSNHPDAQGLEGMAVKRRDDYVVVEAENGRLLAVKPDELTDGPEVRLIVQSSRPHIAMHNGSEVRIIRAIKPGDTGYSENAPQVVAQPKDGPQFTLETVELIEKPPETEAGPPPEVEHPDGGVGEPEPKSAVYADDDETDEEGEWVDDDDTPSAHGTPKKKKKKK